LTCGSYLIRYANDRIPALKAFSGIVVRHDGDSRERTLSSGEQYRAMAFAELTYRESPRDIETCRSVQAGRSQ
jgi:hypothetical protein